MSGGRALALASLLCGCIEEKVLVGGGPDGGGGSPDSSLFDARPGPDATPFDAPPGDAPDPCSAACPVPPDGYFRICGSVYDLTNSLIYDPVGAGGVLLELWDIQQFLIPDGVPMETVAPEADCRRFVTGAHPAPSQGAILIVRESGRSTISYGAQGSGAFDDAVVWHLGPTGFSDWQGRLGFLDLETANLHLLFLLDGDPLPPLPGSPQPNVQVTSSDPAGLFPAVFFDSDPLLRIELEGGATSTTGPNGSVLAVQQGDATGTGATLSFSDVTGCVWPDVSFSAAPQLNGILIVSPFDRACSP